METRIVEKKMKVFLETKDGKVEMVFKDGTSKIVTSGDYFLTDTGFKQVYDLTLDDILILKEQV